MSKALTDQFISDAYVATLQSGLSALPSDGVSEMYDGLGNKSSLSLGQDGNGATITGSLTSGNLVFPSLSSITNFIDFIYPVGSVFLSADQVNPSVRFGGAWQQISQGRFLAGVGEGEDENNKKKTITEGNNVGEYEHTLTENEMAKHTHQIKTLRVSAGDDNAGSTGYLGSSPRLLRFSGVTPNPSLENLTTGNDEPHNITPPGFGVYVWQRIS